MIHSRPNSDDRVHLNTNDVLSQRPKAEREAALTIWPNTKSTNILAEFGKDSPKERRILRKVKGKIEVIMGDSDLSTSQTLPDPDTYP